MSDTKQYLDYDGLTEFKNSLNGVDIVTTAGDGANYTATVPGITALKAGLTLTLIPHTVSTAVLPKLNVNGLGAKAIRRRLSNSTVSTVASASANWLGANKPIRVTYDGTYWIADMDRPNATDLYGTLAIANGGTGAGDAATARTNLGITPENIGAVKKSGDTMTGPLNISSAAYPAVTFSDSDTGKVAVSLVGNVDSGQVKLQCHALDTTYYDAYWLPKADTGMTANNAYSILTTKNAVTVAQGGTGATDAATARTNLGAASLEYAKIVGNPHNLLDNSYFKEPVNQRGANEIGVNNHLYWLDRWMIYGPQAEFSYSANGVTLDNGGDETCGIYQRIPASKLTVGKTYTLAAKVSLSGSSQGAALSYSNAASAAGEYIVKSKYIEVGSNQIVVLPFVLEASTDGFYNFRARVTTSASTLVIEWMALYEGEYTADTLPKYQPKGYAAELAMCQRYAIVWNSYNRIACTLCNSNTIDFILPIPQSMRAVPSINKAMYVTDLSGTVQDGFEIAVKNGSNEPGYVSFRATKPSHGLTSALLEVHEKAILSADL